MAIWIGKQKFSVQKVISIKLLVTLPKTSSEFHRMTQISHKTKKSPAFVIASFQSRVFFLKNLETICKKGSDAAMVESDLKKNRTSINKKHCVDYLILLHYKIFSISLPQGRTMCDFHDFGLTFFLHNVIFALLKMSKNVFWVVARLPQRLKSTFFGIFSSLRSRPCHTITDFHDYLKD